MVEKKKKNKKKEKKKPLPLWKLLLDDQKVGLVKVLCLLPPSCDWLRQLNSLA